MFVGNVPITAKEKTIRKLFHEFGTVEAVRFRSAARPDLKTTKKVRILHLLSSSVADPEPDQEPYVIGPPRSGSFYNQAKIVRKTLIPIVL